MYVDRGKSRKQDAEARFELEALLVLAWVIEPSQALR